MPKQKALRLTSHLILNLLLNLRLSIPISKMGPLPIEPMGISHAGK